MVEKKQAEAPEVEEAPAPKMKRRDLLEASKLLRRHKLDPQDPVALSLASNFLSEKKSGETSVSFQVWLDEDLADDDEDEGDGEDVDPTE